MCAMIGAIKCISARYTFKEIERIACACTYRMCPVYSFRFKRRPENLIGTLLHTRYLFRIGMWLKKKKKNSVLYLYNIHTRTHTNTPSALSFHNVLRFIPTRFTLDIYI